MRRRKYKKERLIIKISWYKNKAAPIPEYYCREIEARIFQRTFDKNWVLICWKIPKVNPIGQISFFTLKEAKKYLEDLI